MKLAELTWPDLEQVSRDDAVVVYPIAAFEQHGPHLPFITDTAEVAAIVDRLDAEIPDQVLCLPAQWLGYSPHHLRFKGTITAQSETHINMIVDTVSSMVHADFDKILIVNGHGGNVPNMNVSLQRLMEKCPDARIYGTSWFAYDELGQIREAGPHGWGHAGEMETSVMMALHPEWVKADRLQKDGHPPQSERAGQVARYRWIHQSTDQGTYGDPTFGSAEKGERFISAAVEVLVRIVEDIRKGHL
ncbi:MAG: creatininase family protein [Gemmatimonadetes bacterium]|nr:creatininase family protein [Gemmatimonadota bacterium]